jgi:uncharacterized protein YcbK (DUF882 family)
MKGREWGGQVAWYDRAGLSARAEQLFDRASVTFVTFLAGAWAYSIGSARVTGDKINLVTPATAAVTSALTEREAPTAAYVTTAIATAIATIPPSALGESGKLRAAIQSGSHPGIFRTIVSLGQAIKPIADFTLITLRPALAAHHGRIGFYYLGRWPAARKAKGGRVDYTAPSGFIEVTPATADARLSEHFTIRDFLTHDQQSVWPKYVVINLKLVDKLELVLADLEAHGIDPAGIQVMSGFRTPHYNAAGGDPHGRAELSRHMYGDAADIYIDNDHDGRMDDLNHDGRVDIDDARVILAAVDRVERAHPSLVGGCGVYAATPAHGPFIHIDTRGYPARWVGTGDN